MKCTPGTTSCTDNFVSRKITRAQHGIFTIVLQQASFINNPAQRLQCGHTIPLSQSRTRPGRVIIAQSLEVIQVAPDLLPTRMKFSAEGQGQPFPD
jgi:hypothetical protein